MLTFTLLLLAGALVLLITWWYLIYFKFKNCLSKYNGPPVLPLIGNAYSFTSTADVIPAVMRFKKEYGNVTKLLFGYRARLAICDHKAAEFILGSQTILEKSYEYKFLQSWLGSGLLTASGKQSKKQRKFLTSAFHFQILERFIEIFNSQGGTFITKLQSLVGSDAFDVFPLVLLYTLDVICEAAMGTQINAQNNSKSPYILSVKEMCRIIVNRTISAVKMFDVLFKFSNDYRKQKKALKVLHGFTNSVITKRRRQLVEENKNKFGEDEGESKKKLAFLDLLLQASVDGQPLSNERIREEVDTFMFEGHDTTSSGISFTLYCLSKNLEIQENVVEELKSIFGTDKQRPCTYKDLQEMKYLEMVIKEALRLYPPVTVYSRVVEKDIEFDGGILPKNLTLSIFPYGLHRNAEIFPDPEKFDPQRFSTENISGRSPYAYIPFSAGLRNCIGQKFAILEMKTIISKILRNYKLLPALGHEPVVTVEVVLKSSNGLLLRIEQRGD